MVFLNIFLFTSCCNILQILYYFLKINRTSRMLASYSTIIGTAIMTCVNMSVVGDTTAAKIKATTMRTRRLDFKKADVISPIFARKNKTRGSSKTTPKGSIKAIKKDRYELSENIGCSDAVAKPIKNNTAAGNTA